MFKNIPIYYYFFQHDLVKSFVFIYEDWNSLFKFLQACWYIGQNKVVTTNHFKEICHHNNIESSNP